ncbi:hypothetical protein Lal_00000915 [Lupinus albus]|uniref:Uncharacterized protein n=1 Tax=Lupinus albus TaxID=3870 RepID=A0A6A4NI14_LUPAL|nr:hypothetical protein Lalb_Chr24g0399811 [Lupinus albus]KAF1859089.1 hypothetical protein Lal_00000915 [Lupinus albus]
MKDQGYGRLKNTMSPIHEKKQISSENQAKKLSSTSSSVISKKLRYEKMKKEEEALRIVVYLSLWGPNS